MALHRIKPPRRRCLVALLVTAAVPLVGFLYYCMDEAPSDMARNLSERPPRTVADADNAPVYLLGLGAAEDADPIEAGRSRIDACLTGARREELDAETVPEVRHDADRDGFNTLCRTSLGNCNAWAERLLPTCNESGKRYVPQLPGTGGPVINYRRRLNHFELLRRMLVIRVAARRADVADNDMAEFIGTLPATLRHPYPDKAIRWDRIRGMLTAPTAIDGIFDGGGLDLSYRDSKQSV